MFCEKYNFTITNDKKNYKMQKNPFGSDIFLYINKAYTK